MKDRRKSVKFGLGGGRHSNLRRSVKKGRPVFQFVKKRRLKTVCTKPTLMKLQVKRKRLFKKLNKKGEGYTIDMPYKITHMKGLKMQDEKMPDESKNGL